MGFHKTGLQLQTLTDLKNQQLAIGPEGSGTRSLALLLLSDNKLDESKMSLLNDGGLAAAKKLLSGELDAAIFISDVQSPTIQDLLQTPSITLASINRAEAYKRLHPFLSTITLPEGVINLQTNIPSSDITLLAPTANLLMNANFHPALSILVLQAIEEVHKTSGIFAVENQFPNSRNLTAPISYVADRFYKKAPPLF